MSQERVNQLRTWLTEQNIDAFLVTQPQNRSYLSGWLNDDPEGSGSLLIGQQQQILLTNPLYAEVAGHEAVGWQVLVPPAREYAASIVSLAKEHGWSSIGFESQVLTFAEYEKINTAAEGAFTLRPFEHTIVEKL